MQLMASFTNSPEFGNFIKQLRDLIAVPRNRIESMGGPSERQQQEVESGKPMTITDRTQDQYRNSLQTHYDGPGRSHALNGQFFEAACAAFRGAQLTPELGWEERSPLAPGTGFTLGDLTNPGGLKSVTVGSLAFPRDGDYIARSFADRAGGIRAFTRASSLIAARHKAITLMPWPVAVANDFDSGEPWASHQTYCIGLHSNTGFPRISMDPLRGVDDLEKAYLRAAALGASAGAVRTHLAWAILLANGVAAQSNTSPLQAWMNLFTRGFGSSEAAYLLANEQEQRQDRVSEREKWELLKNRIHADTGLATTVTVSQVILEAQAFLLPWVEEWLASSGLGFSSFTGAGGTEVTWALNTASYRRVEWDCDPDGKAPSPQLWFCDAALAPVVSALLTDRRTGNFVLDERALVASGSQHSAFVWCPVGASERHVVVRKAGTDQWWPVVLY